MHNITFDQFVSNNNKATFHFGTSQFPDTETRSGNIYDTFWVNYNLIQSFDEPQWYL